MSSEPPSDRLPFEPKQNRKKPKKTAAAAPDAVEEKPSRASASGIPDAIAQRMVKRMAVFSGAPTALGISTFIASYIIVSRGWFKLPNTAVLLVSLGFFGLGVLGLSYGALSASWDESSPGSKLGWAEFATNWERMTQAWRSKSES